MKRLTRESILAAQLRTKEVVVPAWDGSVTICEMPIGKRNAMLQSIMDSDGKVKISPDIELKLFIAGMYDPPFTPDDAELLQSVSGAAVSFVAKEIMQFNGMSPDAADEARGES